MLRRLSLALSFAVAACPLAAPAAELTAPEMRWLQGIAPVVQHARQQLGLPLDVIVQPQDAPGAAPLALGFVDGRCKLVLSMRGNAEAERPVESLPPELRGPALELMAAHELGHCRRYLDGAWHGVPAGFVAAAAPARLSPELQQAWLDMRTTRREEAYGDLVGLAWTRERHASLYGPLHAWLVQQREAEGLPGSHHDTLAWLRLAATPAALAGSSLFDGAERVWRQGLGD